MKRKVIYVLTSITMFFVCISNPNISAQVNPDGKSNTNGCPGDWFTDCNIKVPEIANTLRINHNIIWPNPSGTCFYLQPNELSESNIQVRVMNSRGQVVYSAYGSAYHTYRFGDNYMPGLYFVQIVLNGRQAIIKVVKL